MGSPIQRMVSVKRGRTGHAITLRDKVVVITGGGRGIGLATAELLQERGAKVVLGDIDEEVVGKAAANLGCEGYPLDVTSDESFAAFLDRVDKEFGRFDVLINNAGIMPTGPFLEFSDSLIKRNFEIDLLAVVRGCRLAARRMVERGDGQIVNVASVAGLVPLPGLSIYSAAKAGVIAFSEALDGELSMQGVRVLAVIPNFTKTGLIDGLQTTALMPPIEPDDVARQIVQSIETNRDRVVIPRQSMATLGWMVTPRFLKNIYGRRFGFDSMFMAYDQDKRSKYLERVTRS
ncbi:SDR family oxidoreductase [Williamsia muralis]|uniref:SDR family oxidoreductase n=1 Tax=Williamsia marianensis TaxID=85044 RepID=UPI003F5CD531